MRPEVTIALVSLTAVIVMMLAELKRSRANERLLRQRGATEPHGDPYRALALVYPGIFVLMTAEGALVGPSPDVLLIAGFALFVAGKILKLWAITALGRRWSYRVLVLPDVPLISTGPYAYLRHPNYAAVFCEIGGFAMMVGARTTGVISLIVFALLVRKRIAVEEKALGSRYT
ncbi:MAG TPA: isoprenylcysteine carboxylmethyltransferase family protein [Vicinamibacterales bacterium]|nr:isoprenylcysteine carboxylmethyltransferase family protein [Vicinamibacterales bacterium]